jgi:hypothetical protein
MRERGTPFLLFTVQLSADNASLTSAANVLGTELGDLDEGFGVAPIDLVRGVFCVRVKAASLSSIRYSEAVQGPFADVGIDPHHVQEEEGL